MADENETPDVNDDPLLAEAIARRDESRAQVLQARATRAGGDTAEQLAAALWKMAAQAGKDAQASAAALADIEPVRPDPEGTARPLADSEGNFAANAEVAAVGGIGIKGSNSVEGSDQPATTVEEAGTPILDGAQKVVADQPVGEPATSDDVQANQRTTRKTHTRDK